jgi:activator of HSP90 ATPase
MKDYKKYFEIKSTPDQVYLALTNPLTIQLWSGEEAIFEPVVGTEFSLFEGAIMGEILELEEGRKIVQKWFFGDQDEDSIVTLLLHPKNNHTSIELRHINIPDEDYYDLVEGWNSMFMARLQEFYDENI